MFFCNIGWAVGTNFKNKNDRRTSWREDLYWVIFCLKLSNKILKMLNNTDGMNRMYCYYPRFKTSVLSFARIIRWQKSVSDCMDVWVISVMWRKCELLLCSRRHKDTNIIVNAFNTEKNDKKKYFSEGS